MTVQFRIYKRLVWEFFSLSVIDENRVIIMEHFIYVLD